MSDLAICERCGLAGTGKKETPGSFFVELLLWLFFCLPGIIYTAWRLTSSKRVCAACKGELVPINSPRGQMLWQSYHRLQPPPR